MRKDYHMHPTVLKKPERFPLFVQKALEMGVGEICITDHMPLSVSHAKDRLEKGTVREYCARVRELAGEYQDKIKIKCGIEIDYHPSVLGEIEQVLSEGDFDLVHVSSHLHIFEKENCARYTYNDFAKMALENSVRAVESGLFDVLTHPDMYRFPFMHPERFPLIAEEYTPERHETIFKELLRAVAAKGMRLEINPHLAAHTGDLGDVYPQQPIVKWAMELGVRFSYGSDAHAPEDVGIMLPELELHPVYGVALREWEGNK